MTKTEKAKRFLRSYRDAALKVENTAMAIEELVSSQYGTSIKYSDMPKAHNITDLSNFAARLDELESRLEAEQKTYFQQMANVTLAINCVDDPLVQRVLHLRYIKGLNWEEMLPRMQVSWKTMHNYHNKGLVQISNYLEEKNANYIYD